MDLSAPITMKNAAKCDMQCELQNSASHQIFERNWRWEDILLACLFQCVVHIINHNAIEGMYFNFLSLNSESHNDSQTPNEAVTF